MDKEMFWKQFPFGSHLCREPMPPISEMKSDMEILKKNGFNLIKLQENWMLDEPSDGVYYLEKYHELIEYADKLDMGVYMGLTCEQAPNWLWKKHPNCRMELEDGRKLVYQAQNTLPCDGKPGPCFDDPGAMNDHLRFIRNLVTELGEHQNIVVWNTWQEIGYWSERLAGANVCYCPNTIAAFRKWLQSIYGIIETLNEHWHTRYASFEDVEPDRCKDKVCIPQKFYFGYFMKNIQIANILAARYKVIKEADKYDRPVFAHKGSPELGSGADWTYARTQDFFGTSNYPAWGSGHHWDDHKQTKRLDRHQALLHEMWDNLAYRMDYIRSASKKEAPVWAAEYQGGPISTDFHMGRVPSADDMRRWIFTTLGAGATGLSFWVTRAEINAPETNGFSLLDSEGDTTERLEEVTRIGRELQKYPDLFANNNREQADAAILINEWNYQLVENMQFAPEVLSFDVRGWYKTLWTQGVSCDFVEASLFSELKIQKYRTLIVPMMLSLSDKIAEILLSYAYNGGNLILEGACGRLNEAGFAVRSQMNGLIRDSLDIKVERSSLVREPGENDRWSQNEYSYGDYEDAGFLTGEGVLENVSLKANMFIETYKTDDISSVCLRWNGKPAGIVKQIGKGIIIHIGTCIGPNATAYIEPKSLEGIAKLLKYCDINPLHTGKLLLQKRTGNGREAWFITNPEKEPLTEMFKLPKNAKVYDIMDGEIISCNGTFSLTLKPLEVKIIVVEVMK